MRTINRFDTQSFNRCYRNAKIIYDISKYGAKGLSKVNPVLVFIDTTISLGELYDSYIKYNQVKERNKQLESELNTLKHEFSNLLKELNLDKEKLKYQLETEFTLLEKKLENNRIEYVFYIRRNNNVLIKRFINKNNRARCIRFTFNCCVTSYN